MTLSKRFAFACLPLGALLCATSAPAFVVTYNFNNPVGSTPDLSAIVTGADAAGVNAGAFFISTPDSVQNVSTSTNMAYIRSTGTQSSLNAALDGARYFSFTLSAVNGSEVLDLSSLTLDIGGSTNSGNFTANFAMQSSVGGTGSSAPVLTMSPSSNVVASGAGNDLVNSSVAIVGAEFDSLSSVTFTIVAFDTVNLDSQIDRFDNIVISGSVVAVPEPATYAMLAGALVLGVVAWRRRRA